MNFVKIPDSCSKKSRKVIFGYFEDIHFVRSLHDGKEYSVTMEVGTWESCTVTVHWFLWVFPIVRFRRQ